MPTYPYQCKWCRHEQDEFHDMLKTPRVRCRKCGHACRKMVGAGCGVLFRGSGFYETDYRRKKGCAR